MITPPPWLALHQARFGAALRAPLDRATGTLAATPDAYDPALVADVLDAPNATAAARLAIYQRQYWFRLFDVLQSAFPLTARLLGFWTFNGIAARYLDAHPPSGVDVEAIADPFAHFAARDEAIAHDDVLVDALSIDAAYRDVFRAPRVPPFHPTAADAAHLADARLIVSPACRLVRERSALIDLRARILASPDAPIARPSPHATERWFAIARPDVRTATIALDPLEAALLDALSRGSLRDALATVEQACPADDRASLPRRTHAWLARAVSQGFFSGMVRGDDRDR